MNGNSLEGMRILVVEDELLIALEISDVLENAGAEVAGPYSSLQAAVEAAETVSADLAILDIDLQGMEVFPAAQILRERGVPFLFYTGQPNRPPLRTTFSGVPVYVKPMPPSRLVEALGELLRVVA